MLAHSKLPEVNGMKMAVLQKGAKKREGSLELKDPETRNVVLLQLRAESEKDRYKSSMEELDQPKSKV
jgi:hypothetical protein